MVMNKSTKWILMICWHISISRRNPHRQSLRKLKRRRVKSHKLVASVKLSARLGVQASASNKLFIQKTIGRLLLPLILLNSLKRPKILSSRNLRPLRTRYHQKFQKLTLSLQQKISPTSNLSQAWKNFQEDLKKDASRLWNSMQKNFAQIIMRLGLSNCKPNFTYSTRSRVMEQSVAQAHLVPSRRSDIWEMSIVAIHYELYWVRGD